MRIIKTFTLIFLALALQNCQQKSKTYKANGPINIIMGLKTGEKLRVKVVFNNKDHTKGLSGTPSYQFAADQGMLFFYDKDSVRRFWMPDTYFDLDIFFLDKDLKVLAVDRNVAHHPGRQTPPEIAQSRTCLLYTSPSPRDRQKSRMPSSA